MIRACHKAGLAGMKMWKSKKDAEEVERKTLFSTGDERERNVRGRAEERERERNVDPVRRPGSCLKQPAIGWCHLLRCGTHKEWKDGQTKFEVPPGIIEEYFMAHLTVRCFVHVKTLMSEKDQRPT